jgi:hypothetical protein
MNTWMLSKICMGAIVASTLLPACSGIAKREEVPPAESEVAGSTVETESAANGDVANEGCGGAGAADALDWSAAPANLQMLLTDAPGDFQAVPVTIDRVEVYMAQPIATEAGMGGAGGAQEDGGTEADGGSGGATGNVEVEAENDGSSDFGWIVVADKPATYDLLELQQGLTAGLGGAAIPAGHYTQLRLIVSSAAVMVDGEMHELKIPSGEQTGLKLNAEFDLASGADYVMTLDFDAQQSVKKVGPNYLLTPVISVKSLQTQI